MADLGLDDIVPKSSSFKLGSTGDKEYKLRPFTLADESWLNRKLKKGLGEIMGNLDQDPTELCKVIYHLMEIESKEEFLSSKETVITEEGTKEERVVTGLEKFMRVASGPKDKVELIMALNETIGVSRDQSKKAMEAGVEDSEVKK